MYITYDDSGENFPEITFGQLINKSHKIGGKNITYAAAVSEAIYPRVNLIGDNKTGKFKTASVVFGLDAYPSYSLGEDDEDNSLVITLSGSGATALKKIAGAKVRIIKSLKGTFGGTLGCGCTAYGHISPTRVAGPNGPTDIVDDVAAVDGTWRAVWKTRTRK